MKAPLNTEKAFNHVETAIRIQDDETRMLIETLTFLTNKIKLYVYVQIKIMILAEFIILA